MKDELGKTGQALYDAIADVLDLDAHELALLKEAGRVADRLDDLDVVLKRQGLTLPDGRVNPALAEARQQGIALARIIAALRLPDDLEAVHRPQHRQTRGVYSSGLRAVER